MRLSRPTIRFYLVAILNTLTGVGILLLENWMFGESSREWQITFSWLVTALQGFLLSKYFVWKDSEFSLIQLVRFALFGVPTLFFSLVAFFTITVRTSSNYIVIHVLVSIGYSIVFLILNNSFTFSKSKFRFLDV